MYPKYKKRKGSKRELSQRSNNMAATGTRGTCMARTDKINEQGVVTATNSRTLLSHAYLKTLQMLVLQIRHN